MNTSMCPKFERAMEIISQRWVGLIIYQLLDEPKRFKSLEESMGISARVLSERLKNLEEEGIVKRDVFPETPVRIEYSLTKRGKALKPVIQDIENWADTWIKKTNSDR